MFGNSGHGGEISWDQVLKTRHLVPLCFVGNNHRNNLWGLTQTSSLSSQWQRWPFSVNSILCQCTSFYEFFIFCRVAWVAAGMESTMSSPVRSQHTWVCNLASPRNSKKMHLSCLGWVLWLVIWETGRAKAGAGASGSARRDPALGTAVGRCSHPSGRSESLGLFFLTSLSSLASPRIPGVYSCLNTKGFTLIVSC